MYGPPENDFLRRKTAVEGVYSVATEVTRPEIKCSKRERGTAVAFVWERADDGRKVYVNGSVVDVGGGLGGCPENNKDVAGRGKRDGSVLRVRVKLDRFGR